MAWGSHGLGAQVLDHLRVHGPGLEQGHGPIAQLFVISAALTGPGLGFLLVLAGMGPAKQGNGTQRDKNYRGWPGAVGVFTQGG